MRPEDLLARLEAGYEYDPMYGRLCNERDQLKADNANLRELVTYALKHIIEFECEEPDLKRFRGKPCEDCADRGSSDCPKCMPVMFDISGIEV